MPRQIFWMQQHSVEHFPTCNLRQLMMPPLAEFAGREHDDTLAGRQMGEFRRMVFPDINNGLCFIDRQELKGALNAQYFGALLVIGMPIALLQASSAKNDLVVSFWVCVILLRVLRELNARTYSATDAILLGIAFGAAMLTKGTGVLFALPLAVIHSLAMIRNGKAPGLRSLIVTAAVALTLNAGHLSRNMDLFGKPFGPDSLKDGGFELQNEIHTPGAIATNVLRNIAPHLSTPDANINKYIFDFTTWVQHFCGIEMNDPRITWQYSPQFTGLNWVQSWEDQAAAQFHFSLLFLLPFALFIARRQIPIRPIVMIFLTCAAGGIIFSAALKWQIWHVRLVAPLLCLACPAARHCVYGSISRAHFPDSHQ